MPPSRRMNLYWFHGFYPMIFFFDPLFYRLFQPPKSCIFGPLWNIFHFIYECKLVFSNYSHTFSKQLPFWIHAHNFLPCLSELFTVRNYIKWKKVRKLLYFLISVLVKLNIVFYCTYLFFESFRINCSCQEFCYFHTSRSIPCDFM